MIDELELTIWGRKFLLPIVYECYVGESVTENQISALELFVRHLDWIEKSKVDIVNYCKDKVLEDEENDKKDNIFSYIKPEQLFIKHDLENPRIAMMCKYRYDPEHGLAVVFSSEGEVIVGTQDIIL